MVQRTAVRKQQVVESFVVSPVIERLIPPLTEEEYGQLKENIRQHGCRDPLTVWAERSVLLDGHNRRRACEELGVGYAVVTVSLPDEDAAHQWVDENQLGRRNLTPDQAAMLRGRMYNRMKKSQGGTGANQYTNEQKGQSDPSATTAVTVAQRTGVSPKTVKRDGQFADAVEKLSAVDPDLQTKVISGQSAPRSAITKAAQLLDSDPELAQAVISGEKKLADVIREKRRADIVQHLESVETRQARELSGTYDVVVLDPPWEMQKIERDERPNQSEFDYPTMSEEELAAMDLPCADDCHVWVWTTQKFLPQCLRLLEKWGLKYVCTFVWHKPGGFQVVGLPQYNCEFAVYARKGSPEFIDTKALFTCFEAPRGGHSEKPEEFYDVVRRVTAGRRLDMFNRREIAGFEGWGNESPDEGGE